MKNIIRLLVLNGCFVLLFHQTTHAQTPCDDEVVLVSPDNDFISTDFTEGAIVLLTASNTIDNASGEYISENTILLQDGFQVYNSDNFLAHITTMCETTTATENVVLAAGQARNYPNPFQTFTHLEFSLLQASAVRIELFDGTGRFCGMIQEDTYLTEGTHRIQFDASTHMNGIYFYQIKAGREILTGKMTLIRS